MPAKGFLAEVRESVRHFYAKELRGEVSDANVRGYLRAASQIEDVWQQIDNQLDALLGQGIAPWDAYARMRYPLAFIRAARTHQIAVRELLAADAAADPATAGYLPRVTYDLANALCHQILPNLQHAIAALHDPAYVPDVSLPLALGPRVEVEQAYLVPHLLGMINATREVGEWVAGLIAQYRNAVSHAALTPPPEIAQRLTALDAELAQAASNLRFGEDLVGQLTDYGATPELHEQAEDRLWDALGSYFLLNQAVAMPELLAERAQRLEAPPSARNAAQRERSRRPRQKYHDKHISPHDLWRIAAATARTELQGTPLGTAEMKEMCAKMGGVLSAGAQQYLDEVDEAVVHGDAYSIAAMATCPFEPLYRARRPLNLAGAHIPAGYEFHWNFHRGHIESAPRFGRAPDWQECAE
ncbi:MAG: hypothetical protein ACXWQR_00635 [Ktedonobacterales bacterium]